MRVTPVLAALCAAAAAAPAAAQSFPPDGAYVPLNCRDTVMTDLYHDEAGALRERDIVGDAAGPAGYRAVDADFLYLRLRLDDDPAPGGTVRPFAWGFELDTDGVTSTYEILILADGVSGVVALYANTTTTQPNDPTDPADEPAVATYPFATHARSIPAAGSSYGGDSDFFLDMAVPWPALASIGLTRSDPVVAWAASSSTSTSLNGDFACHDGAAGDPTLSATTPDPTVLDPTLDSDGDGYTDAVEVAAGTDPYDAASHPSTPPPGSPLLEGGAGCAMSSVSGGGPGLLALIALAVLRRRRRR